jgi:prophage antirepressor-like protein
MENQLQTYNHLAANCIGFDSVPPVVRDADYLVLRKVGSMGMAIDIATVGDEVLYYAPSLAKNLGYQDARDMMRMIPDDERSPHKVRTAFGDKEASFLKEPGFYRVMFNSRSKLAEPLVNWVFHEVLPSIRKTGQYKIHQDAKALGITMDFTDDQWAWLALHPGMVDLIPYALAGYEPREISRKLNYKTASTGVTAKKQIDRLKSLGFVPKVVTPYKKQLETRIKSAMSKKLEAAI